MADPYGPEDKTADTYTRADFEAWVCASPTCTQIRCCLARRALSLLVMANEAFDEVTGDYPKELVRGEPWREFADASNPVTVDVAGPDSWVSPSAKAAEEADRG